MRMLWATCVLLWRRAQARWRAVDIQSRTVLCMAANGVLGSLILGGVVELVLVGGDIKGILPWTLRANTVVWIGSIVVPPLLAATVLVTRRADLWLGFVASVLLASAWFMLMGGVFATCQGASQNQAMIWWTVGIVGGTGVAGVVAIEWKLAPWI